MIYKYVILVKFMKFKKGRESSNKVTFLTEKMEVLHIIPEMLSCCLFKKSFVIMD